MIRETASHGRKRSYILTEKGKTALENEYRRLQILTEDYRTFTGEGEDI